MAPKREPEAALPGDDRFGRAMARKRRARKYRHGGSVRCGLPECDRLRREREREIYRLRREREREIISQLPPVIDLVSDEE